MDRQELINYLKDVFELESQLYSYEQIAQEYMKRKKGLGTPRTYSIDYDEYDYASIFGTRQMVGINTIPIYYDETTKQKVKRYDWKKTPEYKETVKKYNSEKNKYKRNAILLALLVIILSILIYSVLPSKGFQYIFITVVPPVGLSICAFVYFEKKGDAATNLAYYLKECYSTLRAAEANKIAESEKPLLDHLEKELNELVIKPQKEIRTLLNKVYSANIIFPKYRNYAAVSQIYEYLLSGRCSELEGPYGAYNLYESELRQNIIIDNLVEINKQLATLNKTMNLICSAVQATHNLLGNISSTLGRIETNTALTAYNSQCIANNTNISNRYY